MEALISIVLSLIIVSVGFILWFFILKKDKVILPENEMLAYNITSETYIDGRYFKEGELPKKNTLKLILSILAFISYCPRFFKENFFNRQIGLNANNAIFSSQETIVVVIVSWLALLTLASSVMYGFFRKRTLHDYLALIGPISVVLNLIYLDKIAYSISESDVWYNFRNLAYYFEVTIVGIIVVISLLDFIKRAKSFNHKEIIKLVIFFFGYLIPFMPIFAPQVLFGILGEVADEFVPIHRFLIYQVVLLPFIIYLFMRHRNYEERYFLLVFLSLSGFINYFSQMHFELAALPLHLCNTAIIMMLVTYMFKLEGVFYFTYLVNVLGATLAILLPEGETPFGLVSSIRYWYNHLYAAFLPILGVPLKIFKRPNMKMMGKGILAFTVYFITVVVLNGWFNNASFNTLGQQVDYFFSYSTYFIDIFEFARPLYVSYDIHIGGELIRFFPIYQTVIYVVFVSAMFGLWGIYASLYKVSDSHYYLRNKRIEMNMEKRNLKKLMGSRDISEPLDLGGIDMIKIEHFSKKYNGASDYSVKDVNLEIKAGEVFGFIGHNGAGKSTTIKSMVGIQSITDGRIEIEGYDIKSQPLEAKLNIGYVSDNHAVYERLTGREYVYYVADLYKVSQEDRETRLNKYLEMFDLKDAIDREIKGYSHGMKQKIMVISALIHNPKVWVLDEPLTGLDPTSSYQIKKCMREHADNGNIVFFSSHIIEVVEKICDRIAIIASGEIKRVATMKELEENNESLEKIYLKYIEEKQNKKVEIE